VSLGGRSVVHELGAGTLGTGVVDHGLAVGSAAAMAMLLRARVSPLATPVQTGRRKPAEPTVGTNPRLYALPSCAAWSEFGWARKLGLNLLRIEIRCRTP
jgi:hypothetical protein